MSTTSTIVRQTTATNIPLGSPGLKVSEKVAMAVPPTADFSFFVVVSPTIILGARIQIVKFVFLGG